jgi:hypothetical protein
MILSTSKEAAQFVTNISGWVSRSGNFWGKDERMARYDGCTHTLCADCGKPVEKIRGYSKCNKCREISDNKLFESYKKQEWDEVTPITIFRGDEYFFDRDSLDEYCEENENTPDKLQLLICVPNYVKEINDDIYCDYLPEDRSLDDVAPELAEKIKELNAYIRENNIIISWSPSNIAAIVK